MAVRGLRSAVAGLYPWVAPLTHLKVALQEAEKEEVPVQDI